MTHTGSSKKLGSVKSGSRDLSDQDLICKVANASLKKTNLELNSRSIPFRVTDRNLFSSVIPKAGSQKN